jgi:hypothetical protein
VFFRLTGIVDTPAIHLLPVLLSPATIAHPGCRCHQRSLFTGFLDTGDKFIAGVIVTGYNCSAVSTTPLITENQ